MVSTVWSFIAVSMAVAAIPSVVAAVLLRLRASRGPVKPAPLDAYAVAFIAGEIEEEGGGPRRTILTGIGGLRAAGAILVTPWGNTGATADAPSDHDEIGLAIYAAAARHEPRQGIFLDPKVLSAVRNVQARLMGQGWFLSQRDTLRWRRAALWPLGVLAVGALLILGAPLLTMGDVGAPQPSEAVVRSFGWTFCPLVLASISLWVGRPPVISRAARRAVNSLRETSPDLNPERKPLWSQLGASRAALGVALYGEVALYASDPAYTGKLR